MKPKATISADGTTAQITRGAWSMTIPVENIQSWIAFYTRLSKRTHPRLGGQPYESQYRPVIIALERAQKIAQAINGLGGQPGAQKIEADT